MRPAKKSKRIVVDTSVIKAAGDGAHPAKICRDVLDTIYRVCHRVVLTDSVRAEWWAHPTRYLAGWRKQMDGKKKLLRCENPPESSACRKVLAAVDAQDRHVVEKDIMLLEAALETDRIVISLDSRTRKHIARAADGVTEVANVQWEDLKRADSGSGETVLDWLRGGAELTGGNAREGRPLGRARARTEAE